MRLWYRILEDRAFWPSRASSWEGLSSERDTRTPMNWGVRNAPRTHEIYKRTAMGKRSRRASVPCRSPPGIAFLEKPFCSEKVCFSHFRRFRRRTIKGLPSGTLKIAFFCTRERSFVEKPLQGRDARDACQAFNGFAMKHLFSLAGPSGEASRARCCRGQLLGIGPRGASLRSRARRSLLPRVLYKQKRGPRRLRRKASSRNQQPSRERTKWLEKAISVFNFSETRTRFSDAFSYFR